MGKKIEDYDMHKEIKEQPHIIKKLIETHLDGEKLKMDEIKKVLESASGLKRILIIACGSSYYAGIYGKYLIETYAGPEVQVEYADEFIGRKTPPLEESVVLAISQSGKTADLLRAAEKAKRGGAPLISVTNNPDSELASMSDAVMDCAAGEEKALAATKTFTSTLVLLFFMAIYLAEKRGGKETVKEMKRKIRLLPVFIKGVIDTEEDIRKTVKTFKNADNLLVCGRSLYYPIALEGAHKVKECSYVHAEGLPTGELKHGTMAVIKKKTPVLFLVPDDELFSADVDVIRSAGRTGARIIAFAEDREEKLDKEADTVFYLKKLPDPIGPLLVAVSLQLMAFHLSLAKGFDPDKPRNLNKYVI